MSKKLLGLEVALLLSACLHGVLRAEGFASLVKRLMLPRRSPEHTLLEATATFST